MPFARVQAAVWVGHDPAAPHSECGGTWMRKPRPRQRYQHGVADEYQPPRFLVTASAPERSMSASLELRVDVGELGPRPIQDALALHSEPPRLRATPMRTTRVDVVTDPPTDPTTPVATLLPQLPNQG